jgi:sulfatase maturation enzyme AslB (radical SAM superfamily)
LGNFAEALAGQKSSARAMQKTCDSYAVVEHNGDMYPCCLFVRRDVERLRGE